MYLKEKSDHKQVFLDSFLLGQKTFKNGHSELSSMPSREDHFFPYYVTIQTNS